MQTSDNGIRFIKEREAVRLTAYQDTRGIWTIGTGHIKGVKKGDHITANQATMFLLNDLKDAENAVNELVKVPLNENQFDALVSFVFNLGKHNLEISHLLRYLNQKQYISAANEFEKWDKEEINGDLIPNKGLKIRRDLEAKLFLS